MILFPEVLGFGIEVNSSESPQLLSSKESVVGALHGMEAVGFQWPSGVLP